MDINSLSAAARYSSSRPITEPNMGENGVGAVLKDAAKDFATTLHNSEATAKTAITGGADPHVLVQALAQAELAVEAVVTVRDRVVEAYQEILRMPV